MKLVYVLEMMECDWDGGKYIKGIFSDANEAVDYVKDNYYLINDERDVCIPNYPIKGDIFQQYGYDVLVVDGKLVGYLTDALELLAYAYHTGENYIDRDDLEMKYYEHLDCGYERWGFLP